MNVLSVKINTNLGGRKMSETKLLTPDDEIIKARIGRKHRWRWTKKQFERRQLEVLGQLMKEDVM